MSLNNIHPVDFKFGNYISEGYDLYVKNFGKVLLAFFFLLIMSIIPFCGYLGIGNFFKFMKRFKNGENPEPIEIFNFDDFFPFFKIYLVLILAIAVLETPIIISIVMNRYSDISQTPAILFVFMVLLFFFIFWIFAKAIYMPALISLKKITSVREAWCISVEMSSGNTLLIIAFMLVITFLSQLGFIAVIIGVFFTLPFYYTAFFSASDDGLKQAFGEESQDFIRKF